MAFQVANNLRFRRSFGRIRKIIDLPYLIEIQKNSYDLFLQKNATPAERQNMGVQEVFKSVFPIKCCGTSINRPGRAALKTSKNRKFILAKFR